MYISHKNSSNVKVNFTNMRETATATALIDSGATKNFVNLRMAEQWKMPRKTLHNPRPIVNVDGTPNKVGAVKEACILEITHQGHSFLQRFYVMDLGFDRVLLGYPWLTTFNPQINWKTGAIEGEITLKTMGNAWERWRELRRTMAVAQAQIESDEGSNSDVWDAIARTNFAQDWSREANKAKQAQTTEARLPDKY
jgi:hypothetical protein